MKLYAYAEITGNLKMDNLISVVHEGSALFVSRKWFIYLLEICFREVFSVFEEII